MNEEARELLVQAALEGRKQIKYAMHDGEGGSCAVGILHEALHATYADAVACMEEHRSCWYQAERRFGINLSESTDIVGANDDKGWDFLTIARKVGRDEEA
jgi:hypothetical protein